MNHCVKHPDREARLYCQKTNRWFCDECGSACMAPRAYCKFRTACVIWALEHDRDGDLAGEEEEERNQEDLEEKLERTRAELEEATRRIPAHSVQPQQIEELEKLEQRVEELKRQLSR